jgi:hypothetical protein
MAASGRKRKGGFSVGSSESCHQVFSGLSTSVTRSEIKLVAKVVKRHQLAPGVHAGDKPGHRSAGMMPSAAE